MDRERCQLLIDAACRSGDVATRLVLADALLEAGMTAWAEFIQLSCKGHLSPAEQHRLRMLRGNRRQREWLGPIAPVTIRERRAYDRGLLDVCTVDVRGGARLEATLGQLPWRSVRRVVFNTEVVTPQPEHAIEDKARFVRSPELVALRELGGVPSEVVLALAGGEPLPLRSLGMWTARAITHASYADARAALASPAFARVTHLVVGFRDYGPVWQDAPPNLDWFVGSALAERVEVLELLCFGRPLEAWQTLLDDQAPAKLVECRLSEGRWAWRDHHPTVRLVRDASGRFVPT